MGGALPQQQSDGGKRSPVGTPNGGGTTGANNGIFEDLQPLKDVAQYVENFLAQAEDNEEVDVNDMDFGFHLFDGMSDNQILHLS